MTRHRKLTISVIALFVMACISVLSPNIPVASAAAVNTTIAMPNPLAIGCPTSLSGTTSGDFPCTSDTAVQFSDPTNTHVIGFTGRYRYSAGTQRLWDMALRSVTAGSWTVANNLCGHFPTGYPGGFGSAGQIGLVVGAGSTAPSTFSSSVIQQKYAGDILGSSPTFYNYDYLWWGNTQSAPSSGTFPTNRCGTDPGPPPPAHPVPTPETTCARTINSNQEGTSGTAKIGVVVTNTSSDATDTFETLMPWETNWVPGNNRTVQLPDYSTMPNGGWWAKCKVTRTLNAGASGSGRWAASTTSASDVQDCPITNVSCLTTYKGWSSAALAAGGVATATYVADPLSNIYTSAITTASTVHGELELVAHAPAVEATAARGFSVLGSVAAVAGSAIAGYVAGGALSSLGLDDALGMDTEWLCHNNPGYRQLSKAKCESIDVATAPARSQTRLTDSTGTTVARTAPTTWQVATTIVEVLIDPTRPSVGNKRSVALEDPVVAPDGSVKVSPTTQTQIKTTAETPTPTTTSTGETDDGDCPSGFGLLNPFNLFRILKCVFIWAFVPTNTNLLKNMWGDITTKAPFSWAYEAITFLPGLFADINSHTSSGGCYYLLHGSDMPHRTTGATIGRTGQTTADLGINCGTNSITGKLGTWATFTRSFTLLMYLVALAFGTYRTVLWAIQ